MLAEIITIGDEILIGQVVDTNSAWIAACLQEIGVEVVQITSVSDSEDHIVEALNLARKRASMVLITGGLGPTRDDITKKTLAKYFNSDFYTDQIALEFITGIFKKRNMPILDINLAQADLPKKCTPLYNSLGTAPGMWFEDKGQIFISMPGVPYEMKHMMETDIIPKIKARFELPTIIHKTFLTAGIGESFLSLKIQSIEDALPPHIKLAYLPKFSTVRLRFSARGLFREILQQELDVIETQLYELIEEYILANEDISIEEAVGRLLLERNKTVATAESCTGGYLSHLFTSVAGSSAYFIGSVIAYANDIKLNELGVRHETLSAYGAVSEQTVLEMASGLLAKYKTDFAIATSGIAGPGGGTTEKPVGTVWIAVVSSQNSLVEKFQLHGQREQIIQRAAINALNLLRKMVLSYE